MVKVGDKIRSVTDSRVDITVGNVYVVTGIYEGEVFFVIMRVIPAEDLLIDTNSLSKIPPTPSPPTQKP